MAKVALSKFAQDMELELLYDGHRTELEVLTGSLNRPGLQLAGFFDYFADDRIQLLGKVEISYLNNALDEAGRIAVMDRLLDYQIPCMIVSRNQDLPSGVLDTAQKHQCPLFRSRQVTTQLYHDLTEYLDLMLALKVTRPGALLDIAGVGMLLIGESGIGKSETALELVRRGHRLVADDVVEIRRMARDTLLGTSPGVVQHFMEIRGVGIINIQQMYGVGSVLNRKNIHLVVELETWNNAKQYDRLGQGEEKITILGVALPKITIPVKPGRNLAIIMEVAAHNFRLKRMGYDALVDLNQRLTREEDEV